MEHWDGYISFKDCHVDELAMALTAVLAAAELVRKPD
jgi:hypothetical protein